ncbi:MULTISPECIES: HD family phosphohydrolase [Clostridium]|uniref:HD family phosphohydrolase n=2 Tax=Clostridiaceae TaxID=31979 RepID=UPI00374F1102
MNMSLKRRETKKGNYKTKRILLFTISFVVTYFLLITAVAPTKYELQEGDIAREDIVAQRETVDEQASEEKLKEALSKVDKQYTLKAEVKIAAENNINTLFEKLISLSATELDEKEKIVELRKIEGITLEESACKFLLSIPKDTLVKLKSEALEIIDSVYVKNIEDEDSESLSDARSLATEKVKALNLNSNISNVLNNIILEQIKPNFYYDKEKTEEKIKEVQKNTEKVVIKKNQIIVQKGEPVTSRQIEILTELGLIGDSAGEGVILLYIVLAILLSSVMGIQFFYIYKNYRSVYLDFKKLVLINLINVFSLILVRCVSFASPFMIPLALAPLLMTMLINYKISLFVNSMNVIIVAALTGFNSQVIIIAIVNALVGATILRKMQQRNDILYSTLYIAVLSGVITFATGVILSSNLKDIFLNSAFSIIGTVFAGVLATGLLPFLESTFNIVTTLKLLELSNPNSPLLKKLLMEAPGTYHHSMLVANLAELAAEEVKANPVIARIGAYYHDVGKTTRPYFFKENQISKENPHDKITANLSTLIIISHVKEGLELAKEYNIPEVIQDIIAQHHGTTLVKYFYYTVKNNSENPDEVREEDFRYPGPIPSTKEAGIIMLADSVEAAVRSINEPTKGKIEEMVNNIIKDKLHSGQLNDCDLTLKDLETIRKCFLKTLNGIYHQRIEYPTEKSKSLK